MPQCGYCGCQFQFYVPTDSERRNFSFCDKCFRTKIVVDELRKLNRNLEKLLTVSEEVVE